ncbi:SEL1-like repeat protein [Microvirga rosea]|uniref:hypothetical protein n=1 Tax=Microvirga rosea TaxID=2715425 RepID=UPI001D0B81EE|nr:hypothetical protein [Microvirga rosea]MCB8823565.1 hypothetical protein [Microvirga rosea]
MPEKSGDGDGPARRVIMPKIERFPGKFLQVPAEVLHGPARWRWLLGDADCIEISRPVVEPNGSITELTVTVPAWTRTDECVEAAAKGEPLSADTLNSIGFALSFAWRVKDYPDWIKFPGVDFGLARRYFERAVDVDPSYWPAINNLAVMARDGLGCDPDPTMAAALFHRAAQSLELTPLHHLVNLYRTGAVEMDPDFLTFLEELITVRDEEERDAA